ncbi:glutamate-5-semialdehyde dehydrogenase [Paenibacillus sp. GXUN7292]|uniref:glutamate-5-semialdehyde dehydrogenase n=1 Tax=Paenibacillus sp. GXUN7292 TaxID=3422499 RepID=UPI003D7CC5C7
MSNEVVMKATLAQKAARIMNNVTTEQKNEALLVMADALVAASAAIIEANKLDLKRGQEQGTSSSMLDRLALDEKRIEAIANGLREIVQLPDPVGELLEQFERPNGIHIRKLRVPLGVIGMIYEARPNVTVDATGLCLKTSNCVVLRGGSAALESNRQIVAVLRSALENTALPADAIQLIENSDRSSVNEMLKLKGLLDVIIPRGGAALINNVVENSIVPVIETGAGVCHTYIDKDADVQMASEIAFNAKVQRPSVCNAMETLIIHRDFASLHLEQLIQKMIEAGVELRLPSPYDQQVKGSKLVTEQDYATEYNDYILNIAIVDSLDEALVHINRYSTKHSECIVTNNKALAERFIQEIDAAAVYHNVSTRFTDGFEFGYGAEIGISTQKLHARGPMGLPALTSTKYQITGNGQIRQ